MLLHLYLSYPCLHNIYIYIYTLRFTNEVAENVRSKNKSSFLQMLLLRPHQWQVIVYAPSRLQGIAFMQKIFLFYICTWEKILLLRMKDLVVDINRNKYNILWLIILNLFTRNLCLQFQEMFDWCWEQEHHNLHDTRF